ncbi:PPOX class F420-dependent oxidoreductase [Saccharopolyspora erythraea]|uniref:PPOX class F420-dependent oxidoreductase n=1 Tax=Saccharopolyspora erythraea TaxID=1836 RepID=UPI001BF08A89|nr:PPOX class F420-dependent oxidoreductase [Saccharopolyspora erythraea]
MTADERRRFLMEGTRTAKIATVRENGGPHVVPVWFVLDGDDLVITTGKHSAKGRAVLRDGRVALCVDDETPPFAFVVIEGRATTTEDPDEVLRWSTRNAARYVGAEKADEYGRLNAGEGSMVVRVSPTKIIAENNITGG